jgi:Domain of unknown function (DUF4331)
MSHNPTSYIARRDPRLNIADLYVFDADAATVMVMNVGPPLDEVTGLDPLHTEARYEFKIHLDGGEREDVTYRVAFLPSEHDQQPYSVERLTAAEARDDGATGTVIARGRTGEPVTTVDGGQVWAGRAVQPFYLDLRQLQDVDDLVRRRGEVDVARWIRGVANDTFTGSTVRSIVLSVPLGTDGLTIGRQIATWATTRLATDAGGWQQVGRSGLPMICEIFRPVDGGDSTHHEETHPADDPANYGVEVAELLESTVQRLGTSDRPGAYADSVMERIVPDLLRYVVGSPAVFGFARFNGRRLADNAPEVVFSLATNSAVTTGLRATDVERSQAAFPFVIPVEDL